MPDTEELHPFHIDKEGKPLKAVLPPDQKPQTGVTSSFGDPNDPHYSFNHSGSRGPKGSPERRNALNQEAQKPTPATQPRQQG